MRYIFALALSISAYMGLAQEQVSDVYYDELHYSVDLSKSCSFHTYDGIDYLFIDNDSLQIFELVEDEFVLNHTVQIPNAFSLKSFGNISLNSSQQSIEENYYYSFYQNGLVIINIEDGSIFRNLDISDEDYRMLKVVDKFEDNIYFIGRFENSERRYFRYNLGNNKLEMIDASVDTEFDAELIGNTLYYNDASTNNIIGYDLLTESQNFTYEYGGELLNELTWGHNLGMEYATFRDQTGFKIINHDHELIEFSCPQIDAYENAIMSLKEDKAIFCLKRPAEDRIDVYNIDNCNLLQSILIDDDVYDFSNEFYINDNLIADYSVIGYEGHYFGSGLGIVVDHKKKKHSYVLDYDFVKSNAVLETTNGIYWIGYDEIELSPIHTIVKRYDKITQNITSVQPYEDRVFSASLGIVKGKEIYFVANSLANDYKVWKTENGEDISAVQDLNYRSNLGIWNRTDIKTGEGDVVSTGRGGLMITNEETQVLFPGDQKFDLMISDNYIAAIITEKDSNYLLKYDKIDESSKKIFLSTFHFFNSTPKFADPFVFEFEESGNYYYDIENEEFKLLDQNAPSIEIDPWKFLPSKDKMIITEYTGFSSPQNFYFFDLETETLSKIEGNLPRAAYWLVTENNSFYYTDLTVGTQKEIVTKLRYGEPPIEVYNNDCHELNLAVNPELQNGEYAFILLRCAEELRIIADSEDATYGKVLAHNGSYNPDDIIVHLEGDEALLKTSVDNKSKVYLFKAPNSYNLLDIPVDEELVTTCFDVDRPLIVTLNESDRTIHFYILIKETNELDLRMVSSYDSESSPIFRAKPVAISDSHFILSFLHKTKGNELFEIDLKEQVFELMVDFNEGSRSSFPFHFTRTSDYIYFIAALRKDGRQWFRISTDVSVSSQDVTIESLEPIRIYPNPSQSYIQLDQELTSYSIYSLEGNLIHSNLNFAGGNIKIDDLLIGTYVITGVGKNGLKHTGKFVKVR